MKRLLIALMALAVGAAAVLFGPSLYRSFLAARLWHAAEKEAARNHPEQAVHLYVLSLQREPDNLPVLKSFAAYLQKLHHPGALEALRRLHTLEPENLSVALDYVATSLAFGRVSDALHILATLDPRARSVGRYFHLISVARFMSGALPEADAACAEALKLEPGNKVYLANQATIELSSPSEKARESALARLEKLTGDENTALTALQSLLRYAAGNPQDLPHLDQWLQAFERYVRPRDYLFTIRLEALRQHRPDDFRRSLALYLQAASQDFEPAAAAAEWLAGQQLPAEVLSFRAGVHADWQDRIEFLKPAVRAAFELGQWEKVATLLDQPAWKSCAPDALAWRERLRRTPRTPGKSAEADAANWRKVLAAAGSNGAALTSVLELARQWGWHDEYAATLWAIALKVPGGSGDALSDLFNLDLRTGDSRDLLRVVKKQLEIAPGNPAYLNNLAFLSLLLDADAPHGEQIARDLEARFPGDPQFVATLAFAQLKKGRASEGLKLFDGRDTAALRGTAPGATYGLLLAAEGHKEAADFLREAEVWMRLPEERTLLDEARRRMAATDSSALPLPVVK